MYNKSIILYIYIKIQFSIHERTELFDFLNLSVIIFLSIFVYRVFLIFIKVVILMYGLSLCILWIYRFFNKSILEFH